MPFLETRELSHVFPPTGDHGEPCEALSNVSLSFSEDEFVLIAGRSGSGKTVLIRHLNGLLRPTSGSVLLEGTPLPRRIADAHRVVGMVFQEPDRQIVGQTVEEDVAFGPRNIGLTESEVLSRVNHALDVFALDAKRQNDPRTLSGGEKRRLAIAGVFAMRPRIVVCDEPFSNLDYPSVVEVLSALLELRASGCGVIVVTHEIEKVLAHADRLIVLDRGSVVHDGTPAPALHSLSRWGLRPPVPQRGAAACPVTDRKQIETISWMPEP